MIVAAQSRSAFSGERENSEDPVRVDSSWTSWESCHGISDLVNKTLSGKRLEAGRVRWLREIFPSVGGRLGTLFRGFLGDHGVP